MDRRSFLKRAGLLVGIGLIQPVGLIKLFKPKSTTFYSFPPVKTLTASELSELLKKTYGKMIVELFNRNCETYNMFCLSGLTKEKGYQYAIRQA